MKSLKTAIQVRDEVNAEVFDKDRIPAFIVIGNAKIPIARISPVPLNGDEKKIEMHIVGADAILPELKNENGV